ncbi:AfsR/SARP family transcriptional regulator [Streptomyces noursei]|uniref:AfsR/SARP family transcriptional regulator n=1 Tax=Streptomyces noursei TaxID=1971 RepID=UPI001962BF7B|nr:tetratricopeptide repeat protein [Streptomyces noursei]QRX91346.1 tetratricopeptide repeat protein [Streptomyces noursei]
MEIQVLGPVGLVAQSRRFGLGSDKERLILASLALEAGRPVSLDTLIDRLWEGDAPANDRKNVHVYVSRIRKALREYGAGPDSPHISRHAHTYALRVNAGSIDWHRFQHLTSQARSTADRGDTKAAVDLLHQADDLWRGDALAGLPGLWPERTRRKLAQRRLGVTSSRIALELRLHRFADVVGDLADLVDQHPDDETLIGHLMVAYYGCGRHADALRAYQVALRRLRAELGTEPGEELAHIHQRILRRAPVQDLLPGSAESAGSTGSTGPTGPTGPLASAASAGATAATWSVAAPSGAAPPVTMPAPHNLPRQSALVGRQAELRRLSQTVEAVADHGSVVTLESISGMAGIGKTALAINAARHMGDRFPDGQLYLDLRAHARVQEPLEAGQALAMLLRLLGVPADAIPADIEERTALWRTILARRRVILVLDDAASPSQVIPLLPSDSRSLAIVTSRWHLAGLPGAHSLALDVLPPQDAIALFLQFAGEHRSQDIREVEQIVHLCGYLPLAIELVANRFSAHPSWTLATLRERLARGSGRLGEIRDGFREIGRAFEISYQTLTPGQRSAFRLLGLHLGSEFGPHAAAALLNRSLEATERLLEALLQCHLLQEPAPHRYRFHDLLGEYARALVNSKDDDAERCNALDRLTDFYLCTASRADALIYPQRLRLIHELAPGPWPLPPFRDVDDARSWLSLERANLLTTEHYNRVHSSPGRAAQLCHILAGFLDAECHWTHADRLHGHAVSHWQRTDDRRALCLALLDLGGAHAQTGHYPQAEEACHRALELARALGDPDAESEALRALGVLDWNRGKYRTALDFYLQALAVQNASGNAGNRAKYVNNIAIVLLHLGEYQKAQERFLEAIDESQRAGDTRTVGKTKNNLGDLHVRMGNIPFARRCIEEALDIAKKIRNPHDEAIARFNLADITALAGNAKEASKLYRDCLLDFQRLGDRKNEANGLIGLGAAQHSLGRFPEAIEYHTRALDLARSIGARYEECRALRHLGNAEAAIRQLRPATEHFESALLLARRTQDPEETGRALEALAEVRHDAGALDTAQTLWENALGIFRELGDEGAAARVSGRLQQTSNGATD